MKRIFLLFFALAPLLSANQLDSIKKLVDQYYQIKDKTIQNQPLIQSDYAIFFDAKTSSKIVRGFKDIRKSFFEYYTEKEFKLHSFEAKTKDFEILKSSSSYMVVKFLLDHKLNKSYLLENGEYLLRPEQGADNVHYAHVAFMNGSWKLLKIEEHDYMAETDTSQISEESLNLLKKVTAGTATAEDFAAVRKKNSSIMK